MKDLNREAKEKDNEEDLYTFNKLLTLQSQMESLKTKGFLRAYRSYTPPSDLRTRFLSCVSEVLETEVTLDNMDSIEISDSKLKFTLLKALNTEFDHRVHNSRLHMMKNLGDLYLFYKSPISSVTPYDKLHDDSESGLLPDNLVIQKDPIRFTGRGDHPLDTVSPFPRTNTVIHNKISKDRNLQPHKPSHNYYQEEDYN